MPSFYSDHNAVGAFGIARRISDKLRKMVESEESRHPILGETVFCFRWIDGRLTRVDTPGLTDPPFADGPADVAVTINIHDSDRGAFAADVRVQTIATDQFTALNVFSDSKLWRGDHGEPARIGTALWRSIPIGSLIDEAIQQNLRWTERLVTGGVLPKDAVERRRGAGGKRGRPKLLTPELASSVIAPAYLTGGSKPVQAVRDALEQVGHPGASPDGVTIDQARKAVTYARRIGALPKASGRGKA